VRIEELLDRYAVAVRAKDLDAFASLYADDVVVFDMWGTWAYHGLEAWRAVAADWFGSLGDEAVAVTFQDVETRGSVAHMRVRYAGLSPEGEELRSLTNRMTWVVEGDKVVHEHSSSPGDFETGKLILNA
jgi:uncharacterized protein (TIGR02246 family)